MFTIFSETGALCFFPLWRGLVGAPPGQQAASHLHINHQPTQATHKPTHRTAVLALSFYETVITESGLNTILELYQAI